MRYRRNAQKTEEIDFTNYKALSMNPVNRFEREKQDYTKTDEIIETLRQ